MTLSLAVRNLLRNRRRSLATLLALPIGAASVLLFGGFVAAIRLGKVTDHVQRGGHYQIQHEDLYLYGNGNPTGCGIAGYDRIADAIRRDPQLKDAVKIVSPMLQFGGIAGNHDAGVPRTAEVGAGRAVGLRQSGLRRLFLAEGFLLGCAGALTGVVAALAVSGAVNRMGLDWLPPASSTPPPLTIRVWGEPGMILGSTLGLVAVAARSARQAGSHADRLNIVDALRHA